MGRSSERARKGEKMKKLILILMAVLLIFPLAACDLPAEPASGDPEFVLEPERKNLPSYEDLSKIESNMDLAEIQSIIGNPQRIGEYTWRMPSPYPSISSVGYITLDCYIYDGADGSTLYIGFQPVNEGEVTLNNVLLINLVQAQGNSDITA